MARLYASALTVPLFLALPAVAESWSQEVLVEPMVHGHAFERVALQSQGCSVRVKLTFMAPEKGYASGKPERDYYRFKARVRLNDGRAVITPVFGNRAPGKRVYTYAYDTSAEGCWAETRHKIQRLDVEACRGKVCTPEPFK